MLCHRKIPGKEVLVKDSLLFIHSSLLTAREEELSAVFAWIQFISSLRLVQLSWSEL